MSQSSAMQGNQQTYERDLANLRKKNEPEDQPDQQFEENDQGDQEDQENQENELEGEGEEESQENELEDEGEEGNQLEFDPYQGSSGENQGQYDQYQEAFNQQQQGEMQGYVHVSQKEIGDEPPENKNDLIEFLKAKLFQAENQMNTVYMAIQIEKEKREDLMGDLEETKQEIMVFYEEEQAFLGEKVQERITDAMTKAIEDRVQAENELAEAEDRLQEKDSIIQELDEKVRELNKQKYYQEIDSDEAQYRINEQESQIESYNQEINKHSGQNEKHDIQIDELRNEINDMRATVENLVHSKNKLNHYINEQRKAMSRESNRQGTANSTASFQKKSTHATEEARQERRDDDFWYADPVAKAQQQSQTIQAKRGYYVDIDDVANRAYNTIDPRKEDPSVKLPVINRGRGEILYKQDEYMEDYAKSNVKNPKDKKTYKGMFEKKKGF